MELERYRRQLNIPEIGTEGQNRLAASSVLVVGAGGLGRPKAEVAARQLAAFNPELRVEGQVCQLDRENGKAMLAGCQLAVAAVDNLEGRLALNAVCVEQGLPLVNGGVEGWYGTIMAVEPRKTPCLACCYTGTAPEQSGEALGAVTGAVGSLMSSVALQLLLGENPIPGELLLYDGKRLELERVPVERSPSCPVCGT